MHHNLTDNCAVYGRLANLADLAWVQHDLPMNHAFDCGPVSTHFRRGSIMTRFERVRYFAGVVTAHL
jgi:hypothetical protein